MGFSNFLKTLGYFFCNVVLTVGSSLFKLTSFTILQALRYLRPLCRSLRQIKITAPRTSQRIQIFTKPSHQRWPIYSYSLRFNHTEVPIDGSTADVGKIEVKMNLIYTCKSCGGHNSHMISKQAYEKGVVIVTCESCNNRHLIADNLNWFEDIKEKNVEEILAKKGEVVLKVKAVPENAREYSE